MFGIDNSIWLMILLAAISAGAVSYAFLFSTIETENSTQNRINKVKSAETDISKVKANRDRVNEVTKRRKTVQESLKDMEKKKAERTKNINPALKTKLIQAGLQITERQLYMYAAVPSIALSGAAVWYGAYVIVGVIMFFALTFILPRFVVTFLWKRRLAKFLDEFPSALEVICRSIKSGLPLNDAMRLIAADGQEPVKSEFRKVIDAQALGISIPEACGRMYNNVPLQEVNFFSIVIAIQATAGGNLSEALGNLAKVLRGRKQMKAKITALAMEAKVSAMIIGSLPFVVVMLVYMSSPAYILILFTDPRGHLILICSLIWMAIGTYIMRQMISFEI
jgi:tight adherence protein B